MTITCSMLTGRTPYSQQPAMPMLWLPQRPQESYLYDTKSSTTYIRNANDNDNHIILAYIEQIESTPDT